MLQLVWTLLLLLLLSDFLPACKALENERKGERDVGPGNLDVDVSSDLAVRGGAATSSSSSSYVLLWTVRKGMVAGAAFCGDC
jgi:hypothetical protein